VSILPSLILPIRVVRIVAAARGASRRVFGLLAISDTAPYAKSGDQIRWEAGVNARLWRVLVWMSLRAKHGLTARQVGEVELGASLHKAQGENARLLGTRGAPVYEMHSRGLRKYPSILGHPPGTEVSPSESHGADDDGANAASSAMLSIEPSSSNSRRRSSMASLSSISPSGSDLVTSSPTRILVGRFQRAHIPCSYAPFSRTTPELSAVPLSTATVYPSEKDANEAAPRHRLQSRSSSDKNKAEMTIFVSW